MPYYPEPLDQLRRLKASLGIETGSPIEKVGRAPIDMVRESGELPKRAWDFLSKAPEETQLPAQSAQASPAGPQRGDIQLPTPALSGPPSLGPNQFRLPSAIDPSKGVTGSMSFGGSPISQTPGALDGLRALSAERSAPEFGDVYGIDNKPMHMSTTEQLYKQAFRDPSEVAPGASQWARGELSDRMGAEDFERKLGQDQQKTVSGAYTQLNPAVRQAQEEAAQRVAYPAQTNVKGALDLERLKQGGPEGRYYDELAKMMAKGQTGNISGISKSGVQFGHNIPPQVLKQLQDAQAGAVGGMFGGPSAAASAKLQQAQLNVINQAPLSSPHSRALLQQVILHPDMGIDASGLSESDISEIEQIYSLISGEAQ